MCQGSCLAGALRDSPGNVGLPHSDRRGKAKQPPYNGGISVSLHHHGLPMYPTPTFRIPLLCSQCFTSRYPVRLESELFFIQPLAGRNAGLWFSAASALWPWRGDTRLSLRPARTSQGTYLPPDVAVRILEPSFSLPFSLVQLEARSQSEHPH